MAKKAASRATKNKAVPQTVAEVDDVIAGLVREIDELPTELQLKREAKSDKDRLKLMSDLIHKQQEQIERLQRDRYKMPVQTPQKRLKRDSWIRMIIPDTHGCYADHEAVSVMLGDMEQLKPREIIHLGDIIDAAGFLSAHMPFVVAEAAYTYADDCEMGNILLDEIQTRAPKAAFHLLEGNHDARVAKWCINQTIRNGVDAQLLLDKIGPAAMLNLKKRGIEYYSRAEIRHDFGTQGALRLGHAYFVHGTSHGLNAPRKMLERYGTNVFMGHIHKLMSVSTSTVKTGPIVGWAAGCLCRKSPLYMHGHPDDWTTAYLFQICNPDGSFWTCPVPIIDNKSLLPSMFGTLL